MNFGEIRDAIFSQADWAPTQSADAKTRTNLFINRAYFQLAQEAPFLFFEEKVGLATQKDFTPKTAEIREATGNPSFPPDTVSIMANDPWVLKRVLQISVAGQVAWDITGAWRGRMLLVTDPTGVSHTRRIRDIWNVLDAGTGSTYQYISLYRPWNNLTDATMDWRIYTEDYYLPDEVIEVSSIRLAKDNQNWPLDIIGQLEAEKFSLADSPTQVGQGVPQSAYRRFHRQIESPTGAPLAAIGIVGQTWQGPEPAGQFEYCFTFCWGYRDQDYRDFGPQGVYSSAQTVPSRLEPLWESNPSPIVAITTENEAPNNAIELTMPDIDYMQGFGRSSDPRYHHSGWTKRIYRRRKTVDSAHYGTLAQQFNGALQQETPDTFYLFQEVAGHVTTLIDNGSILPDYHRRLRDIHGYQSIRMYPRPDARFQLDIRCVLRPKELEDDNDVPNVHPDGINVLLYRALASLYEAQGNIDLADRALSRYTELLFTLTKRYGDLRYPGETLKKKPARSGRVTGSRRPWRRWYNLPNN